MMLYLAAVGLAVSAPLTAQTVRIGVLSLFQPRTLVVSAPAAAPLRMAGGQASCIIQPGARVELRLAGSAVMYSTGTESGQGGSFVFASRDGGPGDFTLAVPHRIERRYRGTLTVRAAGDRLEAVVTSDLEHAVAASVAAETSPATPFEALKAQAVAVRSYYLAVCGAHRGFDFCDTTHCQFFGAPPAAGSAAARAAAATKGVVLTWRGQTLAARYCAACGGRTRSLREVGESARHYPFFAVDCRPCLDREPLWESRLSSEEAAALLHSPGSETLRMQIIRRLGFGALPGNNYTITAQETTIVISGRGRGHGVGLCQRGSGALAAAGRSFRQILARYFPETLLSARGAE